MKPTTLSKYVLISTLKYFYFLKIIEFKIGVLGFWGFGVLGSCQGLGEQMLDDGG